MGEFFALAAIHFLAVVAPGPDFVVTIRQSVRYGRQAGIGTAIGIGVGISVHVVYTLFGVGALMHGAPKLLSVVELIGGLYLLFLGVNFVYQAGKNTQAITIADHGQPQGKINFKKSFLLGFFTNATNPKATLFFLAVFTTVVSTLTPLPIQILYGLWMCAVNALWFVLVSLFFTNPPIRHYFFKVSHWFERVMGVLLILFSLKLFWGFAS